VDPIQCVEKEKAKKCMEHFSSYLCDHASLMGEEEPVRIEFVDESLDVCFTKFDLHSMADNTEDILDIAYRNYRQGKELFSINVYGCSLEDILLTILITPFLFAIYHEVCELMFKSKVRFTGDLTIAVVSTHTETHSPGFPLRSGVRSLHCSRDRSVYCVS
jgi:hypothetical protein